MDGAREFSIRQRRCVYLLERERLGLESIISRSVGWLVKCLFLFYFSVQLSLYMLVCGVMWYVYARARTHKNKTRMYIIHTVKPLLLLLLMIVSCFWGLYFRISQCRQLLQLLFSRIRSIVYWCVYDYCNSIHFVSCGKTLASLSFRIQRTKIVCCFFLFSLSLRFAFAYAYFVLCVCTAICNFLSGPKSLLTRSKVQLPVLLLLLSSKCAREWAQYNQPKRDI